MSSRNVAVRKDVYDALTRQKRPGESFTHLFLRLIGERTPLEAAFGSWGRSGSGPSVRPRRRSSGEREA